MKTGLKLTLIIGTVLGLAVPLLELFCSKRGLDTNWPDFLVPVEFCLWPTQIFGLMMDSYEVRVNPWHHKSTIVLTYCLVYGGNVILYNFVGLSVYAVVVWVRRVTGLGGKGSVNKC
jgi:hypothetical protein